MKKLINLVLVVLILAGSCPSEAKRKPSGASSQATDEILAVCDQPEGTYAPGELIVTLTEDMDPSKAKIITAKAFYSMRKNNSLTLLKSKLAASALLSIEPLYEADPDKEDSLTRLARKTQDSVEANSLNKIAKFHRLMRESKVSRSYVMKTTHNQCKNLEKFISELRKDSKVESMELNRIMLMDSVATGTPNDPSFVNGAQSNLTKIQANLVWNSTTGAGVKVGVIDGHFDFLHEDIAANLGGFYSDSAGYTRSANDKHGTQVAGVIAAVGDNSIGMIGVAPNSRIYFSSRANGETELAARTLTSSYVINAINNLVTDGVKVINMSFGYYVTGNIASYVNEVLFTTIQNTISSDAVTLVVSSGNETVNNDGHTSNVIKNGVVVCTGTPSVPCVRYFSTIPGIIEVSATDISDRRASFSNYGSTVDISAPGADIIVTSYNYNATTGKLDPLYEAVSGTSFSSPTVAGAIALLMQIKSDLSPAQARDLIITTGDPTLPLSGESAAVAATKPIGKRLNVKKAVDELNIRRTLAAPVLNSATLSLTLLSANWTRITGNINGGTVKYRYKVYRLVSATCESPPCQGGLVEQDLTNLVSSNPTTLDISTSLSMTALDAGAYKFKVQACNDYACGTFSNAKDFTVFAPAGAVTVTAPANNFTTTIPNTANTVSVTFNWNAATNAAAVDGYRFSLTGINPSRPTQTESVTGLSITKTLAPGSYKFSVTAVNAAGIPGAASADRNFTVSTSPDRIENLSAGERNVGTLKLVGPTPTLTWTAIANALYKVEYTGPNSSNFSLSAIGSNSYRFNTALAAGDYTFRVSAKLNGSTTYGIPSSISVRVITERPAAVIIPLTQFKTIARIGKPVISVRNISWNSVATAHSYNTILTKLGSTPVPLPVEQTSLVLDPTLSLGDYSISVAAVNIVGPGLATIQDFILVPAATVVPNAVTITSPVLSAGATEIILTDKTPTLTWNTVSTAFRYELSLEKIQPGSAIIEDKLILSGTSYTPAADLELGKYRLKVHAVNFIGHGQDTIREFYIADSSTTVPAAVTDVRVSPLLADGIRTAETKPTIEWQSAPGAVYYELEIALASSAASSATYTPLTGLPTSFDSTSYRVENDLTVGKYRVRVRARNSAGAGAYSTDKFFNVVPNAVTFINVPVIEGFDYTILPKDRVLTWTTVSGATSYSIAVKLLPSGAPVTTTGSSYTVTATTGNYLIRVTPISSYGNGLDRDLTFTAVPATTVTTAPNPIIITKLGTIAIANPAPANTILATDKPAFTWARTADVIRYELSISQTSPIVRNLDQINVTNTSTGTSVSYTMTQALSYGTYNIKVRAVNAINRGNYGPAVNFTITAAGATAIPAMVAVTGPVGITGTTPRLVDNSPSINITWTALTGVEYYNLTLLKLNTTTNTYVAVNANPIQSTTNSYLWTGLGVGVYRVKVIAHNAYGDGPAPADASLWTFEVDGATVKPAVPTVVTVSGTNAASITTISKPTINWSVVPGAKYYRVIVNQVNADGTLVTPAKAQTANPITGTSFSIPTDLTSGTKYRVRVYAINGEGESSPRLLDFYIGTAATVLPTAPTPTTVVAVPAVAASPDITNLRKPTLAWSAATNSPVYYELQIIDGASGNLVQGPFYVISPTLQYIPARDLANGYYKFKVRAFNAATTGTPSGAGPWSAEKVFYVDATSTVIPLAPVISSPVNNTNVSSPLTITWTGVAGAVYYSFEINKKTGATTFSTTNSYTKQTAYNETLHTISPALSAGTYRMRIYAYNANGKSAVAATYVNFTVQ